jgi:hypothetical protein
MIFSPPFCKAVLNSAAIAPPPSICSLFDTLGLNRPIDPRASARCRAFFSASGALR